MSDSSSPKAKRQHLTAPVASTKMPGGIPYIIGNEAAERFSFYGMKGILVVFMTSYLHLLGDKVGLQMNEAEASEKYHAFASLVYFLPIAGALLSDTFLGKYRTILLLSLVYCLGHATLAVMGVYGDPTNVLWVGLVLIAIGSGGIKPCVSAHVGDQFGKTNSHLIEKVFNLFYLSINFGAFLSMLLTPELLRLYGPHWAFGVPGVLMAIATLAFWMGRNKFVHIPAGGIGFLKEAFSPVGLKAIAKLLIVYMFVMVFWALFDQTGSSWVIQAKSMDRYWLGIHWLPSQMQTVNSLFILIFIPTFAFWLYPLINRVWTLTPLRKIGLGLFVMVGGFYMVYLVQTWIDAGERPHIIWQLIAYAVLTAAEVMVSITCLEFSYTQAPKKMKSVIMAIFLFSVSAGNTFTAAVNHYIQTPSPIKEIHEHTKVIFKGLKDGEALVIDAEEHKNENIRFSVIEDSLEVKHSGADKTWSTADDQVAKFGRDGSEILKAEDESFQAELKQAADAAISGQDASAAFSIKDITPSEKLVLKLTNRLAVHHSGADEQWDTADDIHAIYKRDGARISLRTLGSKSVTEGAAIIQEAFDTSLETPLAKTLQEELTKSKGAEAKLEEFLPSPEKGQELLSGLKDEWDQPLTYRLVNAYSFEVISSGPDKTPFTKYDIVFAESVKADKSDKPEVWLDKRIAELKLADSKNSIESINPNLKIGGRITLQGADYFMFFTVLMLVTAILFIVVALLYKPQTYLHEEIKADDIH